MEPRVLPRAVALSRGGTPMSPVSRPEGSQPLFFRAPICRWLLAEPNRHPQARKLVTSQTPRAEKQSGEQGGLDGVGWGGQADSRHLHTVLLLSAAGNVCLDTRHGESHGAR